VNTDFQALFSSCPLALIQFDHQLILRGINQAAVERFGWQHEQIQGCAANAWLRPQDSIELTDCLQAVLDAGRWQGRLQVTTESNGSVEVDSVWISLPEPDQAGGRILVMLVAVEARGQTEEDRLRAQRLDSIGTLAGGMAHDLNNVLSPVVMSLNLLKDHCLSQEGQELLKTLETSTQRATQIVRQMLTFAKGSGVSWQPVQLHFLIKETVSILAETFPKNILVETEVASDLWTVSGDATHLHQVLMNLCVNARDAMPHGGDLLISARNVELDECYAQTSPQAKVGAYVRVQVKDCGCGISEANLAKIYDPFFTTKGPERGTGLGLSSALHIIQNLNGFMEVNSRMGVGTTFSFYLPRAQADYIAPLDPPATDLPRGNGELILVVDDESIICQIARSNLEKHGYRVLEARDGTEAVSLFAAHAREVDCVITDIVMPLMDGEMTVRAIRRINPNVRFIIISGLSPTLDRDTVRRLEVEHLLTKPFSAETLLQTLRLVLDRPAPAAAPVKAGSVPV
jgi:two-component system, cell cycle sensor histidine kinase and response regulator CckA